MVDVSAQSCTITPMNPNTLTTTGGAIANGTSNVTIRCSCTESDGTAVQTVRWYDDTGSRLLSPRFTAMFNPNVPYYTRVNGDFGNSIDNTDIILVIPTFNDSYDGMYTCGREAASRSALTPPTADVTLTISSELYKHVVVYMYTVAYRCSHIEHSCCLYSDVVKVCSYA